MALCCPVTDFSVVHLLLSCLWPVFILRNEYATKIKDIWSLAWQESLKVVHIRNSFPYPRHRQGEAVLTCMYCEVMLWIWALSRVFWSVFVVIFVFTVGELLRPTRSHDVILFALSRRHLKSTHCILFRDSTGFRRDAGENCALLRHYAASSGNFLPTFRDNPSIL